MSHCYKAGKRAYSKRGAETAVNKRYREDRILLRIYPCRTHWHLTKLGARKKPKKNGRSLKRDTE